MSLFFSLFQEKHKSVRGNLQILAAITLSFSLIHSASAASKPASSVSTTTTTIEKAAPSKSTQPFSASYAGVFSGPSLGHPSSYQPDDQGNVRIDPSNRIVLRNSLNLGYKVTPNVVLGSIFNFNYYPVPMFSKGSFELADPALKVSNGNFIKAGHFTMAVDLRASLPVTQRTRDRNLLTSLRFWQTSTYQIPNSHWSLGAYSFVKGYAYGQNAKKDVAVLDAYLAPFLHYEFNQTASLSLTYEMDATHYAGQSLTQWVAKDPTDLTLGLALNLTPSITFNPWIEIFPGGKVNLDATQFGALISARIL